MTRRSSVAPSAAAPLDASDREGDVTGGDAGRVADPDPPLPCAATRGRAAVTGVVAVEPPAERPVGDFRVGVASPRSDPPGADRRCWRSDEPFEGASEPGRAPRDGSDGDPGLLGVLTRASLVNRGSPPASRPGPPTSDRPTRPVPPRPGRSGQQPGPRRSRRGPGPPGTRPRPPHWRGPQSPHLHDRPPHPHRPPGRQPQRHGPRPRAVSMSH